VFEGGDSLLAHGVIRRHRQPYFGFPEIGRDNDVCDRDSTDARIGHFVLDQLVQFFTEGFREPFGAVWVHGWLRGSGQPLDAASDQHTPEQRSRLSLYQMQHLLGVLLLV